jgi:hypothetical protein
MKSLLEKDSYTLKDIQSLIDNHSEETSYVEFKEAAKLGKEDQRKKQIGIDVSAFANSDGGILVYGLAERDRKANHITYINSNEYSKDWLSDVISGQISRPLSSFNIFIIQNPENEDEQIYVVKIFQSPHGPHMASDGNYYRRTEKGKTKMLEWEVRAGYYRTEKTELSVNINLPSPGKSTFGAKGEILNALTFQFEFFISNVGNEIAHHYKLEVKIHNKLHGHSHNSLRNENVYGRTEGDNLVLTFNNRDPIFQQEITDLCYVRVQVNHSTFPFFIDSQLEYKLFYPNGIKQETISLINFCKLDDSTLVRNLFKAPD